MNQMEASIVDSTKNFVYNQLGEEGSGHDYEHSLRVYRMALHLSENQPVNIFVVAVSALIHDTIDTKVVDNSEDALATVNYFLEGEGVAQRDIEHIINIITTISYRKHAVLDSLEAEIVQDADRLDAMGAIGIARAFTYGGHSEQPIYDSKRNDTTVQHFYDKLLKLNGELNTDAAKKIGNKRHALMQDYLLALLEEIEYE